MAIQALLDEAGLPDIFSDEYDRFAAKWDAVRSPFINPNYWFWSGKRQRWEWYRPDHYTVTEAGLEVLRDKLDQAAIWVFGPLQRSWGRVRANQSDAIWSPRNGGWFTWRSLLVPTPAPKPPTIPPIARDLWIQRMNEELAAVDRLNLSPAEREQARAAIRKRYLGE